MSEDFDFETLPAIKVIPFDELKARLHSELRLSGIYAICVKGGNTAKGMVYIGSSVWFQRRFIGHRCNLNLGNHHAQILQNIYTAHGHDALEVRLIELLSKSREETCFDFRKRLFEREQFWIDSIPRLCLLNATPTAGSQAGAQRSEQQKMKTKQSMKAFFDDNPDAKTRISSNSKKMWEDPDHREHIRSTTAKSWADQSVREARSLGIRKSAATPDGKERRSLASKKAMASDEARLRSSRVSLNNWQRPEYRQVISAARRATWQDPEYRRLRIEALNDSYKNNPSRKESLSRAGKRNWEDPELRERMTNAITERMSKPEEKEKTSKLFRELWADPDYKQKTSQSVSKGHASKSDALIFISPEGQMYVTDNVTFFAGEFGLGQTCLASVARGKQNKHKGWTGYACSRWEDVPSYAIRFLIGDHPDLAPYQELAVVDQQKLRESAKQDQGVKLKNAASLSLSLRLKSLGTKSDPIIYISPEGIIYVSDIPSQFATEMGFEIEGQRHKFSLIIRNGKSYKGWTGYKLTSWADIPNDAIRILWGDHPDLPVQIEAKQESSPIQLSLDI